VIRPWLPGSFPMPEPFVWATDDSAPGVGALFPDTRAQPEVPALGSNVAGLPQNIINSVLSCIEGENRMAASVQEYWRNAAPEIAPQPAPPIVITQPAKLEPHGD
jgi:hypothetical protein